ncbi:MAG: hypothetical protein ACRCX7_11095 [Cetobacterium sp.]|uniref:hypothetical protein n=1 Tax=Cetobacterium sp. TaxID=2071632 RepID=UPI003F31A8EE
MIVNTLITGVKKYFTSLSVDSLWGYKKVSLMEADDNKIPTGIELIIDATTSVSTTINKSLMQHSSESKKVYMDGTKINPVKMTINGHIETTKLADIQRLANEDTWMYVSMTKDIGGSFMSMSRDSQQAIPRVIGQLGLANESASQIYSDCKLYTIQNLSIGDEGFINTVAISLDLVEVVLFEYDMQYKFGVKQNKGSSGKVQQSGTRIEKDVDAIKTYTKLIGG